MGVAPVGEVGLFEGRLEGVVFGLIQGNMVGLVGEELLVFVEVDLDLGEGTGFCQQHGY